MKQSTRWRLLHVTIKGRRDANSYARLPPTLKLRQGYGGQEGRGGRRDAELA